jgi:hypothetical protein
MKPEKKGMERVFAVQVQSLLVLGVSRYKIECEPYIYHRLQILCVAVERSGSVPRNQSILVAGAPACRQAGKQKP